MRITFLQNIFKAAKKQPKIEPFEAQFEKEMDALVQKSQEAVKEISREQFNSETLKALFMPEFKPKTPDCVMAVSTTKPSKPVEVAYKMLEEENDGTKIITLDLYSKKPENTLLGKKLYLIDTDAEGKLVMKSGSMSSEEEACKQAGVKGIGMLEKMLQIKDAIERGIDKIPCYSRARATLFHLKSGFTPVPELKEISSQYRLDKAMKELNDCAYDTYSRNFTPIIVKKDGKYYLDENTTLCLAYLRQIKENYAKGLGEGVRPFISGRIVELELAGENFNKWKQMIEGLFGHTASKP